MTWKCYHKARSLVCYNGLIVWCQHLACQHLRALGSRYHGHGMEMYGYGTRQVSYSSCNTGIIIIIILFSHLCPPSPCFPLLLGVYVLETGYGVPTSRMSYWQRLDLSPGSSQRDVRRAYYHKSLEWHPDRWAKHPAYVDRAKDVFELVSEAYVGLQKDLIDAASATTSSSTTVYV